MEATQATTAGIARALINEGISVEFVVRAFGSKHHGTRTSDFTRLGELERELETEGFSRESIGIKPDRLYAAPEALTRALGTEMKMLPGRVTDNYWWVPQPNVMVSPYAGVINVMEF